MTTNRPTPEVLALLVCDQIITDRLTGKQSLIGMFSMVNSVRFPFQHPLLSVFASLTGGHGVVGLTIRIVDSNETRPPLVEGRGQVEFKSPLAVANLVLQFHGLKFPEPGEYRVQLLSEGALLREAKLRVVQVAPGQRGPGAPAAPDVGQLPPDGGPPPADAGPEQSA